MMLPRLRTLRILILADSSDWLPFICFPAPCLSALSLSSSRLGEIFPTGKTCRRHYQHVLRYVIFHLFYKHHSCINHIPELLTFLSPMRGDCYRDSGWIRPFLIPVLRTLYRGGGWLDVGSLAGPPAPGVKSPHSHSLATPVKMWMEPSALTTHSARSFIRLLSRTRSLSG
jgi:hypothetical protein